MGDLVLQLTYVLLTGLVIDTAADTSRRDLINYLIDADRYDSGVYPEIDRGYPTNVSVQIAITDMHSVSETSMEFSVDLTLRQVWRDYRLDFSANSSVEKLELDHKNIDSVWQPDTFFMNEKRAEVHKVTTTNRLLHIFNNGTVIYSMRMAMAFSCVMDLHLYPFDKQRCPISMQSYSYTDDHINLDWCEEMPIYIDHVKMPKFEVISSPELGDYSKTYKLTGSFSTIKAEIDMQRKSGFYFLHVFLPNILLVALSWVSFWVDASAVPARVSLGVTCILTMTTQSAGTRQRLPPVSYIKAIDVWMFVCLLFVFAALLEFAYVNVVSRRAKPGQSNDIASETTIRKGIDGHQLAMRVDYISRLAFPGSFVLFVIIFSLLCTLS